MPLIVAEYGAIVVMTKYVEQKKTGGVYYFRRRVPYDVKRAYLNLNKRGEIYFSLKTKSPKEAAQKAHRVASEQDGFWRSIRNGDIDEGPEVIDAALPLLAAYGLEPGQQAEWDKYEIDPHRFYDAIFASAGVKGPEDMDANWLERVSPVLRKAIDLFADATTPIYLSQALK